MNDPDIVSHARVGLKVYDVNGEIVGTVEVVDQEAGTMRVATNPFVEEGLVIPLGLIQRIDPREIFLACPKDSLPTGRQNNIQSC